MLIAVEVMNPKTGNPEIKLITNDTKHIQEFYKTLPANAVIKVEGFYLNTPKNDDKYSTELSFEDQAQIERINEWLEELP